MTRQEMESKVKELKELKNMAQEIADEITAIEDEIKAEMTAENISEILLGAFKVSWKEVISNRFDSKAFKATHSELYSQYTKQTKTKRFLVA